MKRRGFLGALIGAPLVGKLSVEPESVPVLSEPARAKADAVLAGAIDVTTMLDTDRTYDGKPA